MIIREIFHFEFWPKYGLNSPSVLMFQLIIPEMIVPLIQKILDSQCIVFLRETMSLDQD